MQDPLGAFTRSLDEEVTDRFLDIETQGIGEEREVPVDSRLCVARIYTVDGCGRVGSCESLPEGPTEGYEAELAVEIRSEALTR